MPRLASRNVTRRQRNCVAAHTTVCVVDPRASDYAQIASSNATSGLQFRVAGSVSEALKMGRGVGRSIWLVNIDLPDGSGCELAAAIRARDPRSVVYLVGDEYDSADERQARLVRGTMYVCKPVDSAWLSFASVPNCPLIHFV